MISFSYRLIMTRIIFSMLVVGACFYCFLLGRSGWPVNVNKSEMVGYCKGRKVQMSFVDLSKNGTNEKASGLLVKLDEKNIYMELDKNGDGISDDILHFDDDRQAYATIYNLTNRLYVRREIEYYSPDNKSRFMVYDSGSKGVDWMRVREDSNGCFVRERLTNGTWVLEAGKGSP